MVTQQRASTLSQRASTLLNILVDDYIATGHPVGSKRIALKHGPGVSPATIRNDMAEMEGQGYISRPHISAGGVPLDKGYRHYVTALEIYWPDLEPATKRAFVNSIQRNMDMEERMRVAADLLARVVQNIAIASLPRSSQPRLKHLELVALEEGVLLLVILEGTQVKRHVLHRPDGISQDQLTFLSHRLTELFQGLNWEQIMHRLKDLLPLEQQVGQVVAHLLKEEGSQSPEVAIAGIRYFVQHPEFQQEASLREVVERVEDKRGLRAIFQSLGMEESSAIIIGEENVEKALRHCSIVLARYGRSNELQGVVGVVGPTRMLYHRSLAAVRLLANLLGDVPGEGGAQRQN
jgi:heat-inducible transcriptional repressor